MDNESKKPCAPVEEEGRDTTTVFREEDPLCAALDDFCYALNFWYGSMNNPWQREDTGEGRTGQAAEGHRGRFGFWIVARKTPWTERGSL